MSENGFYIDTKDFDEQFEKLVRETIPELAAEGLFDAGHELLNAADDEAPQTPYLTGDLRGAREVERPVITGSEISVRAGHNIEYAARLHEDGSPDWNWNTSQVPNPGPKFIESKMAQNPDRFMKVAADYIADHGGK